MTKIEHLGIAVKSLDVSIPLFSKILNSSCYKVEVVESENVRTAFFRVGESKVELLEGFEQDGTIGKFIANRGEGLHHVAFAVDNIEDEMLRLKNEGFLLLNDTPKKGADNNLVCFIHPKETGGMLIELCQQIR